MKKIPRPSLSIGKYMLQKWVIFSGLVDGRKTKGIFVEMKLVPDKLRHFSIKSFTASIFPFNFFKLVVHIGQFRIKMWYSIYYIINAICVQLFILTQSVVVAWGNKLLNPTYYDDTNGWYLPTKLLPSSYISTFAFCVAILCNKC